MKSTKTRSLTSLEEIRRSQRGGESGGEGRWPKQEKVEANYFVKVKVFEGAIHQAILKKIDFVHQQRIAPVIVFAAIPTQLVQKRVS